MLRTAFAVRPGSNLRSEVLTVLPLQSVRQAVLTAADAMTRNVQMFRAVERAGVIENVLQVRPHRMPQSTAASRAYAGARGLCLSLDQAS